MWIEPTTTIIVEALRSVFDAEHPDPDLRGIRVSPEYPNTSTDYPGLWVQVTPVGEMAEAGVGHIEYAESEDGSAVVEVRRWVFDAIAEITVVALTNLERARLVDGVTKTIAFGESGSSLGDFRSIIEDNDLIGLRAIFGTFTVTGASESQGTAWGTDDMVYEMTVTLTLAGEFVYSPSGYVLVPLSAIRILDRLDGEADTTDPTQGTWV